MSDNLLSPFLEPVKSSIKKFVEKNPKLSKWIGWTIASAIIFMSLYYADKEFNIVNFSGKSDKELTIDWLDENFTDSTFNVLIFPFNDYAEDTTKKIKIEKAINDRLDEYRRKELYASDSKSRIRIKFFEEVDPTINPDSLEGIATKYNTDIMIYGNIYDEPKTATINYIILSETDKWRIFGREGTLTGIAFKSLYEFREGTIIKDLDYLTFWLYCNESIYYKNEIALVDIWNSLGRIFNERIFTNSNSFLTARIGIHFHKTNNYSLAKEFYNLSLGYRKSAQVYNNLGLILEKELLRDSAEVCYSKAIYMDSSSVYGYNNLASLFMDDKRDIQKAERLLHKVLQLKANDGIAYFNLGLIYSQFLIDKDSAIFCFKKSFELIPDSLVILRNIGSAYIGVNNDSARYYLLKALSGNKGDYVIYNDLARMYTDLGDDITAEKLYFESLQLNSNNPIALNNLGNIYRRKYPKPDTAISYFKRSIETDKDYFLPYYNLGFIYYDYYKNYKKAKFYLQISLALNRYYVLNYEILGHIFFLHEKRIDSAYFYYNNAIKYNARNGSVYNNLGVIVEDHFGNPELAETYFLKAISLSPQVAGYYLSYAMLLNEYLNEKEKGRSYYLKAIEIDDKIRSNDLDSQFGIKK